jgi:hypothetical protein
MSSILISSIWNKKELPQHWKECIIVSIYKNGDESDCSNYRGMSLLPTANKILSIILVSMLISYVNEMNGDHRCKFQNNR